jgi:hypothetical protein
LGHAAALVHRLLAAGGKKSVQHPIPSLRSGRSAIRPHDGALLDRVSDGNLVDVLLNGIGLPAMLQAIRSAKTIV